MPLNYNYDQCTPSWALQTVEITSLLGKNASLAKQGEAHNDGSDFFLSHEPDLLSFFLSQAAKMHGMEMEGICGDDVDDWSASFILNCKLFWPFTLNLLYMYIINSMYQNSRNELQFTILYGGSNYHEKQTRGQPQVVHTCAGILCLYLYICKLQTFYLFNEKI